MDNPKLNGWIITTIRQKYAIEGMDNFIYLSNNVKQLYTKGLSLGIKMEIFTPNEIDLIISNEDVLKLYVNNEIRDLPDFIIPRTGSDTDNKVSRFYEQLERLGVTTLNSERSIYACVDKICHLQVLAHHGLPIPKTMYVSGDNNLDAVKKEIGFPLVVKIWPGSFGNGISLVNNQHALDDLIGMLVQANNEVNILVQEYIAESHGKDIRVFVLGDKVLAYGERNAQDGNFKSNLDRGGKLRKIDLDEEAQRIALKATKVLGLECAGVDLLYSGNSYKICEVNSAPGFITVDQHEGINAAESIFSYLFQKMNIPHSL